MMDMYQAIYRKFRPKTFDELLGQEHITTILKNQVAKGNIGHAYLFSGTRGTGKTSAAKVFSRAVNCLDPTDGNPCNKCEICKGILDESIMDVIEMDAASNRKIEDIRELKEKVIYPPSKARYKVYIIDEVHMLTNEAFNALLKTLEEPPKHLLFLLATTEPERLPHTILSRCQRFDFKRLKSKEIIDNMVNIADSMGLNIESKVFDLIAKNSDGAMRDALSLLDQCISYNDKEISYEDAIKILGIADNSLLLNMCNSIINKDMESSIKMVNHIIQEGKDISQFLKDTIHHYRNLMIVKTSNNPDELIDWGEIVEYQEQSRNISLPLILKSLNILTDAENSMKWSTQPRIILEMAIIRLVNLTEELSLEERVKRLEEGVPLKPATISKQKEETSKEFKPKRESTASEDLRKEVKKPSDNDDSTKVIGEELNFDNVKKTWPKVMQLVKSRKINIYALAMEGELEKIEHNRITLSYKDGFEFHKDAVSSPQNKSFLEGLLTEFYGQQIELMVIMKSCLSSQVSEVKKSKDNNEDSIKEVLNFFGEDIVEIK